MISRLVLLEWKKLIVQKEIYIVLAICTFMLIIAQKAFYLSEDEAPYRFSKTMIDFIPNVGYLFILFPIIVMVARILSVEYELKMLELTATYKYGRKILISVKLLALFSCCVVVISFFFLLIGILSYLNYGFDYLDLDFVAVNSTYIYLDGQWVVWQVLLMEYLVLLFSIFTFAACLFLVARFVHRSVFIMLIGGGAFLLVELLDKYVMSFIGQMKISEYVNIVVDFSINSLLNFEALRLFSFSQLLVGLMVVTILLILANILVKDSFIND